MLRGSRGSSETALAICGAARLTAHGSAAAVGVAAGPDAMTGDGGAAAAAGAVVADGPGVFETVESLDPHPATAIAAMQITTAHFTLRTVPKAAPAIAQAARRVGQVTGTRLDDSMTSSDPDASRTESAADLTFDDLQIHPSVLRAVADVGYESPSAIQAATIPAMMAGSDVVGLAQTGTGKTAAFAIPILSKIDTTSRTTQALVLAPTRELALQVAEAFSRYGAHLPRQRAADLRRLVRTARSWPGSSAAPRSSSALPGG